MLSGCSVVGGLGGAVAWWWRAPNLFPGAVLVSGIFLVIFALLLVARAKPYAETFSAWVSIVIVVVNAIFISYNHEYFSQGFVVFRPFLGIKLLAMLLPLVCPPKRWVGFTSLAILGVTPVIQFLIWGELERATVGIQEPYVTVIIVIAAGIIYHYKLGYSEILESEMESTIHAKALQRFANMLIASQHLINTPLQKIEILVDLMMAGRQPMDKNMARQFKTNFEVLRRVTRVLSFADGNTHWDSLTLPSNAKELEDHARKVLKEFTATAPP